MKIIFCLSVLILVIAFLCGFLPCNEGYVLYFMTFLNTVMLVFIMGVLVYG